MARSPTLTDALAEVGLVPCGDNSCMFGSPGGMGTNGGCRCLPATSTPEDARTAKKVARRLAHVARKLAAQVDQLGATLAEAKRLGLEACARGEDDAECGREYGCDPDGYATIRTSLEAL